MGICIVDNGAQIGGGNVDSACFINGAAVNIEAAIRCVVGYDDFGVPLIDEKPGRVGSWFRFLHKAPVNSAGSRQGS